MGHNASPACYAEDACCSLSNLTEDCQVQSLSCWFGGSEQTFKVSSLRTDQQTLCRISHIDPGRLWRKSTHLEVSVCLKGLSKCSYKCSYIILYHFISIQDKAVQTSCHFSQLDVNWSKGFLDFKVLCFPIAGWSLEASRWWSRIFWAWALISETFLYSVRDFTISEWLVQKACALKSHAAIGTAVSCRASPTRQSKDDMKINMVGLYHM